jgi:hypothetical protein
MAIARALLNGYAVRTLHLEEFLGKVKGMQPAHSMFCSEQEPGGSILCTGQQFVGAGPGENFSSQVLSEPVLFAVGLGSGNREQMSALTARNLPGAGTERGIYGWRLPSRPHLLESWLLIFVGPDLSQAPPLSCEPMPRGFTGVAWRRPALPREAKGFLSLTARLGFLSLCV